MRHFLYLFISLFLISTLTACGGDSDGPGTSTPISPGSGSGGDDENDDDDDDDDGDSDPQLEAVSLEFLGRYSSGAFDEGAAEIPAFHPASQRVFVVNAEQAVVDVLDVREPDHPVLVATITTDDVAAGAVVNSVAIHGDRVALAIEAADKTDNGYVAFYQADSLNKLSQVGVGALPDMVTFTPDGKTVLVANEGEPNDDYSVDPEGSVSIVDITDITSPSVRTADFGAYNDVEVNWAALGLRIFGPGATLAQDLEPEYIAVSSDSTTAWVTLQENNALAKVDIATATITDLLPLGFKDWGAEGNAMDASDKDDNIDIRSWPGVKGIFMPDTIAAYEADGQTYLVTANEGDARAWGEDNDAYWAGDEDQGFVEEFRVKHLVHSDGFARRAGDDLPPQLAALADGALLNPEVFGYCGAVAGDAGDCREDENLGRLNITWTLGYRTENGEPVRFNANGEQDPNGDRLMYDELYTYGTRSVSIWGDGGTLVWDSGVAIERFLASDECKLGTDRSIPCADYFNSGHDEGDAKDSRSDAKGPEPEGLVLGTVGDRTFAFVGLERMGGIIIFDITQPSAPSLVDYLNSREDWATEDPDTLLAQVGDLGPEGLVFVSADDSPTDTALLIVGNEVSGTTSIYSINEIYESAQE